MSDTVKMIPEEDGAQDAPKEMAGEMTERAEPVSKIRRVKKIKKPKEIIQEVEEGAPWNTIEEAFLRRRSIRKFKKKQVPAHVIRRILEVGRFAPSQGNCQPWKFVVVRDREMIAEMEEFCTEMCRKITGALDYTVHEKGTFARWRTRTFLKLFAKWRPNDMHPVPFGAVKLIAEDRFKVFHSPPTLIIPLMDSRGIGHPEIDLGVVGTNIVMAAQSHGLGTCWVGLASFLNDSKEWRERLGAEDPYVIMEAISVGYPLGRPMQNLASRELHETLWIEDGKKEIVV